MRTFCVAVITVALLGGSGVAVAAQEQGGDGAAPSTFTWAVEEWDYTQDPESGRELRIIRIEATDPRAAGWAFTLDDRGEAFDGERDYDILGSLVKLDNDDGTWLGTWRGVRSSGERFDSITGEFAEFTGGGGYEGLTMYTFYAGDAREGIGFIVPSDAIPPFPEATPLIE